MKNKSDNTVDFKKVYDDRYHDNKKPVEHHLDGSSKVISYSKKRKHNKLKNLNINKNINNFEKQHPFFKKYKPIIIIFSIMVLISILSAMNKTALKNDYGKNEVPSSTKAAYINDDIYTSYS